MYKEKYKENNIFHKILQGHIPTNILIETPYSLCFSDINPQAKTHILVLPKGLYSNLNDFLNRGTTEEIKDLFQLINQLLEKLPNGSQLLTNSGDEQLIPHLHWHILSKQALV